MRRKDVLFKLFYSTFYLSTFTFGGGYVIVTLMKQKFVDELHWIEEDEMLDLVAIAQSAPGPIAINGAISVGYKIAGIPGAGIAVLGCALPPLIILSIISFFYQMFIENLLIQLLLSGMQAGVGALIASVVIDMIIGMDKSLLSYAILIGAFIANYFFDINVAYIILFCILLGIIISKRRKKA